MLGAVIAWIIGRQLARPLVELTGAAETLARGDYSERVTSRGTDEIGRLAAHSTAWPSRCRSRRMHRRTPSGS